MPDAGKFRRIALLQQRLRMAWHTVSRSCRLMTGVPDYETYLAHCRAHHPERTPMTYAEFFRNRMAARYDGGRNGCC
jgi:uncharacterized short protein YbdD (DUF466 family)